METEVILQMWSDLLAVRVDAVRGVAIECVVLVVMLFSGGIVGARGLTTPALVLLRCCS